MALLVSITVDSRNYDYPQHSVRFCLFRLFRLLLSLHQNYFHHITVRHSYFISIILHDLMTIESLITFVHPLIARHNIIQTSQSPKFNTEAKAPN